MRMRQQTLDVAVVDNFQHRHNLDAVAASHPLPAARAVASWVLALAGAAGALQSRRRSVVQAMLPTRPMRPSRPQSRPQSRGSPTSRRHSSTSSPTAAGAHVAMHDSDPVAEDAPLRVEDLQGGTEGDQDRAASETPETASSAGGLEEEQEEEALSLTAAAPTHGKRSAGTRSKRQAEMLAAAAAAVHAAATPAALQALAAAKAPPSNSVAIMSGMVRRHFAVRCLIRYSPRES